MYLAESVTIIVPRVLATTVVHREVTIAPLFQSRVDVVLVGKDCRAQCNCGLDQRFNRNLLNVGQHANYDLS